MSIRSINTLRLILFVGFFSSVLTGCSQQSQTGTAENAELQPQVVKVTTADLHTAISGDEPIQILDVRTEMEIDKGFVSGALFADWFEPGFNEAVNKLDPSKPVYVYCHSGGRSADASDRLLELGFQDVRNVDDGFSGWLKANYPISTSNE